MFFSKEFPAANEVVLHSVIWAEAITPQATLTSPSEAHIKTFFVFSCKISSSEPLLVGIKITHSFSWKVIHSIVASRSCGCIKNFIHCLHISSRETNEFRVGTVEFDLIQVFFLLVCQIPNTLAHSMAFQGVFPVMIYNSILFTERGKNE